MANIKVACLENLYTMEDFNTLIPASVHVWREEREKEREIG